MAVFDPQPWTRVLAECNSELRAYVDLRMPPSLRSVLSSEDVLQQASAEWVRCPPPVGDPRIVRDWLWRTVHSKFIDMVRSARRVKRGGGVRRTWLGGRDRPNHELSRHFRAPGRTPSGELQLAEAREALQRALAALPADYRRVIEQHHLQGLPVLDVARAMGRSRGAVHGLLERALQALRAHFRRPWVRDSR